MHNHFLDKKRRHINLRDAKVESVLPEHFSDSYPKFISLLEKYYDFMDSDHSTELLSHLFAARDVNETDITLLSYIEDELLLGEAYFEGFGETESQKRAAANFSNILFRSKGTKFAIEWFFRSFYGLDSEVTYTKENIFNIGETSSRIGPESLRYITDDKLYQTFALLVRAGIPISKWRETFKLFAHPAGMYLGAEVLIDDDVVLGVNTLMDALAVQQYPTPEYSITVFPATTADEGTEFTFNVSGTGIQNNGTSALYYYIEHMSTNDSDFVTSPPQFSTAAYLPVNSSTASFAIPTRLDTDETETQESFMVKLKDDEDREVASTIVRLNNVTSSYTMSPSNPSVDEGQPLTISVSGTDVPNGGETTLFYYVEHITTVDDDFVTPPPSITNAQPFDISSSTGQFEILTKVDNAESDEQFRVHIKTEPTGGIIKDTITVTLRDVAPSFTVTADDVTEGSDVSITLLADASTIGETVNWVISGPVASDPRVASTSGSFVVASVNQTYTLTTTTSNAPYDGAVNGTVTLTSSPSGFTSNDSFDLVDQPASYTITPTPTVGSGGGTTTFEIGGTSIPDGTVDFYIEHGTTNNADFVGGNPPLVGTPISVNIVGGVSSSSPSLSFVADSDLTEEEFTVFVKQGSTVLTSIEYSVLGSLTYAITPSTNSVDESTSFPSYFVTTDNDGTYYYYVQGTNITADDFSAGYGSISSRQSFNVFSGSGTVSLTLSEDKNREGNETFKIFISKTSTGAVVAESSTITISDTSIPTYTIASGNSTEGEVHTVIITPDATSTENIHLEITGDGVIGRFPITEKTVSVDHNAAFTPVYFSTTDSPLYEGFQAGIVTARFDSAGGAVVGSDSFLLFDNVPSYSLVTDLPNDSASEGDTINFTFSGTGIADSDYFYRPLSMKPAIVDQVVAQGTSFIYLEDTSNLSVGMETNISDIRGVITSVVSSGVQMHLSTLSTIPVGTRFHFSDVGNFDDFTIGNPATGTVTTSANSGTFRIDVAEDSDFTNETYSIRVYEKFGDNAHLASRSFTIEDTTSGAQAEFSNKPLSIRTTTDDISVTVSLRFQTDGIIKSSALTTQNIQRTIGTWLNPTTNLPANAGNYRVRAALSNWNGSTAPAGSFGSWLTLSTDRQWSITVYYPDFDADMDVTFEVQEIGNSSNSDTWSVNLRAIEEHQPDDGTFEP